MKDDACTVRDIEVPGSHVEDVPGFVRVLESYEDDRDFYPSRLRLLVLCDADPIVWTCASRSSPSTGRRSLASPG